MVIADGANSKTAQKIGIHSHRQPYGQQGIIANIELEKPHEGVAYERFTEAGPMAMLPLTDHRDIHAAPGLDPDRAESQRTDGRQ